MLDVVIERDDEGIHRTRPVQDLVRRWVGVDVKIGWRATQSSNLKS